MRNSQGGRWTEADVPAQRGRTAVITGANTGLGFETARALAARDAEVQQRLWRESERLTGVSYPV
jgi:short-subunit dehydrogenase